MNSKKIMGVCLAFVLMFGQIVYVSGNVYPQGVGTAQELVNYLEESNGAQYRYEIFNLVLNGAKINGRVSPWDQGTKGVRNIYQIDILKEGLVSVDLDCELKSVEGQNLFISAYWKDYESEAFSLNHYVQNISHELLDTSKGTSTVDKYTFYAYPGRYFFQVWGSKADNTSLGYDISIYQDTFDEGFNIRTPRHEDYPNHLGTTGLTSFLKLSSTLSLSNWKTRNTDGSIGNSSINGHDKFIILPEASGKVIFTLKNIETRTLDNYTEAKQESGTTDFYRSITSKITLRVRVDGVSNTTIGEANYGDTLTGSLDLVAGREYIIELSGNTMPCYYNLTIAYEGLETDTGLATASSWATSEIEMALEKGLSTNNMTNSNYKSSATREDFAELVMAFYDLLGGERIMDSTNPFTDTSNTEIIRARHAGIINGTSTSSFSPNNNLTREQLCVMILRALEAAGVSYDDKGSLQKNYSDSGAISLWATDSVRILNSYQIMNGSGDQLDPQGRVTKEMAMLMIYRAFTTFKN